MPFIIGIIIAFGLDFWRKGGKVVVKKVGKVAKKAVKIIILRYAYMFYMGLLQHGLAMSAAF